MSQGTHPIIRLQDLAKYYVMGDSVVHALDGVNLTIDPGEFVAITGPSGSGKSTMMHLIGCLERPTRGWYELNGQRVSDLSDRQLAAVRNKSIGFVFQTFNLINRTSALDNVALPLFYARRGKVRELAMRALERVNMTHRRNHRPSELSGGERQRVAIARALVKNPTFLFADEPTSALDWENGQQVIELLQASARERQAMVLVVTHDPRLMAFADRVIEMADGKLCEPGSSPAANAETATRLQFRPPMVAAG